jgi:cellulose synthase/poly-beta-1,6-N-acetylglucosamine synthase-like glycosyltransferase/peptidoglycan/xylan/chitin deacetylase (PgdA/CDA1 family)
MTYDEHTVVGARGPRAGLGCFGPRLDEIFKIVDGSKLIISVASHGTDWSNGAGKEISVQEAWELLSEINTKLRFDSISLNPTFRYVDDTNATEHEVWYLDGVTGYNQVAAALAMRPEGIALWRLGTEDPSIWSALGRGKSANEAALKDVEILRSGYDVLYRGKGEVLNVGDAHEPGLRKLSFDATHNLITNQEIEKHPRSTTVTRWGARDDKVVALTFDDGPDPTYTPKILDILAEKNVKATFFVVGSAGVVNSDILRRTYREGHDIGNHTFTHVNSSEVSPEYLKFEMNATQRLFEASIGIRTRLFRPPYAADLEPQTVDAAEALRTSGSLGYLSIGMNIDPKDWMRPLARQIVAKAIEGVHRHEGNVMLLHDAGGIRTPTLTALPEIIDRLHAEGYRFVTIHELLGLRRDEVMAPVDPADALIAKLNFAGYSLVSAFNAFAYALFYIGIALSILRLAWVSIFAVIQSRKEKQRVDNNWKPASVALLIPTYNEEKVIVKSVRAALDCALDTMDVIVIDDGSRDRTVQVVQEVFANEPRVKLIQKTNGGKWSALNAGLAATTAEVVITIDADTLIAPNAPSLLVRHFRDPKVGAVAGHAVIGNRINLITRFQALEYITNQNMDRRALEVVNGITVVPGAIGAWRREALVSIDGFAPDTLAEDSDATVRLLTDDWTIMYESKAIARTEAPETVSAFMKQRLRWMFGTLQVAYKNRAALWKMKFVGLGFFGLPNILLFQFLLTLAAPVIDLMMVWSLVSSFNSIWLSAEGGTPPALAAIITYWVLFQLLEVAAAALSISLDGRRGTWRLLPLLLVQRFFYRQLLYITAVRVLFVALKGTMMGWGKLVRSGRVTAEPVS